MVDQRPVPMSRRQLLSIIGRATSSAVMYQAMRSLGHAAESDFIGPVQLQGDPKASSVIILGAGLAGMVAALELKKAGYKVQVLEYREKAGGRCWSLRGGDTYAELGGQTQHCQFDPGLYINPGPWRIPYHHRALLHYCKLLGVRLQPFMQINFNTYLHSGTAFGGKPQRYRHVMADWNGHVSELLAKAANQSALDQSVSKEDKEILLEALRQWGSLDNNYAYKENLISAGSRGYSKDQGGGPDGAPEPSKPLALDDILKSGVWKNMDFGFDYAFQHTLFQPVGGMDMVAQGFAKQVGDLIKYRCKVTKIQQSDTGVTVIYEDMANNNASAQATAEWCICTIPASVLSQINLNVGSAMKNAISALPYTPALKIGLQFKRRFWEEDEAIYGGISFTDLPIVQISYPSTDYNHSGKGVLLGAYTFGVPAVEFTAMSPEERVQKAVEYGAQIHPQYTQEFDNGIAVGWHRVPWTLGCFGMWTEQDPKGPLQGAVRYRRARGARRRALLLCQCLAGRGYSVFTERHHSTASARRIWQLIDTVQPRKHSMTGSTHWTMLTAVAGLAALLAANSVWADSRGKMSGTFGSFPQTTGKALYESICQSCHMPNAEGAIGAGAYPALTNNAKLAEAGYPVYVVIYGEQGMPGFGGFLNDDQVAAVVNYVRTNFGNNYTDAVKPDDVTAIRQPGFEYSPLE